MREGKREEGGFENKVELGGEGKEEKCSKEGRRRTLKEGEEEKKKLEKSRGGKAS